MSESMISVVCPTFNSESFILSTLESVFEQTTDVYELIVSDDGSTDRTVDVVEQYFSEYNGPCKCHVIRNTHEGPGATRNSGVLSASADWIAFLDSDDIWLPDKIKTVVEVIKTNSDVNFICHSEYVIRLNGKNDTFNYGARYHSGKSLELQLYSSNLFSTSAVVCKKSLLLPDSLFDNTYSSAQDYELWLRLSPKIKVYFIDEVLGKYVERKGNITSGSLLRRYKNELKIACVYKVRVSLYLKVKRIIRISLSYLKQYIAR